MVTGGMDGLILIRIIWSVLMVFQTASEYYQKVDSAPGRSVDAVLIIAVYI
jgi:hypothetical protein